MNSAIIVTLCGFVAIANAGLLAAPAVSVVRSGPILAHAPLTTYAAAPSLTYAAAPAVVKTAYAGPAIVGAPLVAAGPGLVRVARSADPGVLAASPIVPAVAPLAYASPVVHAPVSVVRSSVIAAPVPVAYSAPALLKTGPVLAASPALVRVARSADPGLLAAGPVAYAAAPAVVHAAPVVAAVPAVSHTRTYHGNGAPFAVVKAAPVLL